MCANACRASEEPDPIRFCRAHKIRQRTESCTSCNLFLLPQETKLAQSLGSRMRYAAITLVRVKAQFQVIAYFLRLKKTNHTICFECMRLVQACNHCLCIRKKLASFRSFIRIIEDCWVAAFHFPCVEKQSPVDERF